MIKCVMMIDQSTNRTGASSGGPRIAGWSESWWHTGTINDARIRFELICQARAGLLANSAAVVGQRYQIIGGGSTSTRRRFPGPAGRACAMPQKSLQCSARVGDLANVRHFALRGIPDEWVEEGELKPVLGFLPAWNAYKTSVQVGGVAFRGRDLSQPSVAVANVSSIGDVTFAAPLALVVGDYIQLRDIHDQFRSNRSGRYQVAVVTDATHVSIRGWMPTSIATLNGFASKYGIVFPTTNLTLDFDGVVNRKVGRPSAQYRGRTARRR